VGGRVGTVSWGERERAGRGIKNAMDEKFGSELWKK
jgi:hypothetical protein